MKRFLSLLIVLVIALSLVGCGEEIPTGANAHTGKSTEKPPESSVDNELLEGGLTVNPQYLDLFGKTKGEVDALFGEGEFWQEWALMVYDNGIQVSYGTYNLDNDLDDSDEVYCVYLPLKFLFDDCPETVTEDNIRNTFKNVEGDYSLSDETDILIATYKEKSFVFYPEYGMNPDACVYISE